MSSRLMGESQSSLRMTSGGAIRLATISYLRLRNLLQMQSGIIREPKMPKKMKKLSAPNLPRFIWAITGSFLYSANLRFRRSSLFSIIYRYFSPGVFTECSSVSSVTPIFMLSNLMRLRRLWSMGGSTSLSLIELTSEMDMFLILFIQFLRMRLLISFLRYQSCC